MCRNKFIGVLRSAPIASNARGERRGSYYIYSTDDPKGPTSTALCPNNIEGDRQRSNTELRHRLKVRT